MQLFIVRHARAEEPDAERWPDDSKRPLTKAGVREFERLAARLRKWGPPVDLVLASGWARAWATAKILRDSARWPKPVRTSLLETADPNSVSEILQLLHEQPAESSIALVGHQPLLGLLVADLCSDASARVNMRKGAVAWLEGEPGAMMLSGLLVPTMLRRAKRVK